MDQLDQAPAGSALMDHDVPDSRELNWRIVDAFNSGDPMAILEVSGSSLQYFNVVNCVTAVQRIAKAAKPSGGPERCKEVVADQRWKDLATRLQLFLTNEPIDGAEVVKLTPHHFSLSLAAFATLQVDDPEMLRAIGRATAPLLNDFQPLHLANTVYSFASAGVDCVEVFKAVEQASRPKLKSFKSQDFANILWAFERVRYNTCKAFLSAAWEAATPKLTKFAPQELATVARAYAALNPHGNAEFFKALVKESVDKMPKFGKPAFLKLVCAFSRVGDAAALNEEVYDALAHKSRSSLGEYSTDELRVLGQALGKTKTRLLRKNGHKGVPACTLDRETADRQECLAYVYDILESVPRARQEKGRVDMSQVKILEEQLVNPADTPGLELVCPICMYHVLHQPKVTKCSHIFCGDCIDTWVETERQKITQNTMSFADLLKRTQGSGADATLMVYCPSCKQDIDARTDLKPLNGKCTGAHAALWRTLRDVKVTCVGKEKGCSWVGTYETYASHFVSCSFCAAGDDCKKGGQEKRGKVAERDGPQTRLVVASWPAADEVQLSLSAGQRVIVSHMDPSGWAYGRTTTDPKLGWFPKVLLKELTEEDEPSDCASTADTTSPSDRDGTGTTPERESSREGATPEAAPASTATPDQKVVVATHVFQPSEGDHQLQLWVGRRVNLVRDDASGWSYGECVDSKAAGWFPRAMTAESS